jgi:hypothetical protein
MPIHAAAYFKRIALRITQGEEGLPRINVLTGGIITDGQIGFEIVYSVYFKIFP